MTAPTSSVPSGAGRYAGAAHRPRRGPRLLTGHGHVRRRRLAARHAARLLRAQPVRPGRDPRHRRRRRRWRCPACTRCSPPPTSTPTCKEQWHAVVGQGHAPTRRARRWPRARCGSSAIRSRSSSPRAATSPRTPSSSSTSTTSRCPPSSTSRDRRWTPTCVVHEAYPDNVVGRDGRRAAGRGRRVRRRPRTS